MRLVLLSPITLKYFPDFIGGKRNHLRLLPGQLHANQAYLLGQIHQIHNAALILAINPLQESICVAADGRGLGDPIMIFGT